MGTDNGRGSDYADSLVDRTVSSWASLRSPFLAYARFSTGRVPAGVIILHVICSHVLPRIPRLSIERGWISSGRSKLGLLRFFFYSSIDFIACPSGCDVLLATWQDTADLTEANHHHLPLAEQCKDPPPSLPACEPRLIER